MEPKSQTAGHSLITRLIEHKWIGIFLLILGVLAEKSLTDVINPIPPSPTVRVEFRDPFNHVPAVRVFIDGQQAPELREGVLELLPGNHRLKAFFTDGSLAVLQADSGEHDKVLTLNVHGPDEIKITVKRAE